MALRVLPLLAFSVLTGLSCATAASAAPPQNAATQLEKVPLSGKVVLEITEGDFVHPAFSPDGKRLAYSGVIVQDGTELTTVEVLDIASGDLTTLLDAESSKRFAVYKSFVFDLRWTDHRTLVAHISDGDADVTAVTFDVVKGKILSEEFHGTEDTDLEFAGENRPSFAFPAWPIGVLRSALDNNPVDAGGDRLVVQKRFAGEDDHIWLLELSAGRATKILDVPEDPRQMLTGGFGHTDSLIFAMERGPQIILYHYQDGETIEYGRIETAAGRGRLDLKHSFHDSVFFQVKRFRSYEQGHNPLFLYDASGLREVEVEGDLYDAAVSPDGALLCLVLWRGGQRRLIIVELPPQPRH